MERWQNKVAVVTGASAGIGACLSKVLVEEGMIVVGLARRLVKMETEVRSTIAEDKQHNFHCIKCDVGDEEKVKETFDWIVTKFGGVDVLVNNAGLVHQTSMLRDDNSADINETINTNLMGIAWCTREAFRSMKERQVAGHVFLINSIGGHKVPAFPGISLNMYPPSKFAVTALAEVYRQEFAQQQTKVKITNLSPGAVRTEMSNGFTFETPALTSEDVCDSLLFCLQTPPHVQIHELIIKPIGENI